MSQQIINDGESGLIVRGKLNDNFTELYTGKDAVTVNTYADLPDPTTVSGQKYWVLTSTGVFLINRRSKGSYYSDGAVWTWLGDFPTTADQIGNVPAGAISATDVQSALNELDADLSAHIGVGGSQHPDVIAAGASGFMSGADKTKLNGIAAGATANATDAFLMDRANHTGTQAIATILAAATARIFGRISASGGVGEELTGTQVTTLLDVFTSVLKGLVPASGGGTSNFLRADGTWAAPAGGGSSVSFIYQNAGRTLTSTTAAQKLFDQTTNGRVTLGTGLYRVEAEILMTGMSATSGNAVLDMLGAGTAVVSGALLHSVGRDDSAPLGSGARTGVGANGASIIRLAGASAGTGIISQVTGVFKVTTAGTLIPSVLLDTAAAATVELGTYMTITKIADAGVYASGDFD